MERGRHLSDLYGLFGRYEGCGRYGRYGRYAALAVLVFASAAQLGIDCGGTPKRCDYSGQTYASGASFPSTDGCNTCSCDDGRVACTARACAALWYLTCGDPVCHGHTVDPNVPGCTTEKAGNPCTSIGTKCDPINDCNARLICATSDPTRQPGGCPISLAKYKRDIRYLTAADRAQLRDALVKVPLATWRYKAAGPAAPERLGFIIDDVGRGPAVSPDGETVDLYGYASMAVAAVQVQEAELATLRAEVAALRAELAAAHAARPVRPAKGRAR